MSKTRPEFRYYEKGPKFPRQHPPIQNPAYGPGVIEQLHLDVRNNRLLPYSLIIPFF